MRSVERTLLTSFFSPEAATIIRIKATNGKAMPILKLGWVMVRSTDWAILGMMK